MSNQQQSSYRQIMKGTSIFGGVQVLNILIQLIRSKVVAVLLGPTGMGIAGLLTATTGLVQSSTNFGLGTSAIKDIAGANESGDVQRMSRVATVFRRLVWITGLLGMLSCLVLAPWLSELTFGNRQYAVSFALLSITLLLTQLNNGQMVLLQGTRKLKELAKANVWGTTVGFIVTLPFYYWLGLKGIIPALIGTAIIVLLISIYFSRNIQLPEIKVSRTETFEQGKYMLRMGIIVSLSSLLTLAFSYLVRLYIGRTGGVAEVGLYNAGFAIINTYVGMVFSAMGTDYYPRLATVAHDNERCAKTINQQAEIALLILAPVLIGFILFMKPLVLIMYSNKFVPITGMLYWAALGMFFKAASWVVAFVFLAKGANKLFFWSELIANVYVLVFNLLGYHFLGLTGMGISFALAYLCYLMQVYILAKRAYRFSFRPLFKKHFAIQMGLAIVVFVILQFFKPLQAYLLGGAIFIVSTVWTVVQLNKRLGLKALLTEKINSRKAIVN
jgi:O-antigen/teichoic acid export membrane protein